MSVSPSFPSTAGQAGWRRRSTTLHERVDALAERVGRTLVALDDGRLGSDVGRIVVDAARTGDPVAQLEVLSEACIDRLGHAVGPAAIDDLAVLVCDAQALRLELHDHELVSRTLRLADCERGLGRLRTCTTVASLLGSV